MDEMLPKINFYFVNQFGEEVRLEKTINYSIYNSEFEALVEEFKIFLLAVSFVPETIAKLQIVEENEN